MEGANRGDGEKVGAGIRDDTRVGAVAIAGSVSAPACVEAGADSGTSATSATGAQPDCRNTAPRVISVAVSGMTARPENDRVTAVLYHLEGDCSAHRSRAPEP